jgi:hypothetical protein
VEPSGVGYDASQIELRHAGMPEHDWHPAAQLRVLAEGCSVAPFRRSNRFSSPLKRQIAVAAAAARLGERGFDIDELVRCVFQAMYVGEFMRLSLRIAFDLARPDVEDEVALFQGALAVADSQWVRNCLAFCLVPSDPAGAEPMFMELLEEGYDDSLVHANLAATNRILGDIETAHSHARTGLGLLADSDSRVAFLWGFEEGAPVLMSDVRVVEDLRFVLSWGPS